MAIIKHIAIKNTNYTATSDYLTMQHDEFTMEAIVDENGDEIPREFYLLDGINCDPNTFAEECQSTNRDFKKNTGRAEIKAHHYIISFDPRDRDENNLTPERAQELGMEFAKENFPGHQMLVCTHRDGHNSAGNIHVHIVLNSVRKFDVPRQDFMERPSDHLAGYKHHVSDTFLNHLKQSTMELCQKEQLNQVDLLSPSKVRITDREYWAQRRGQAALDQENEWKLEQGIKPEATVFETQNEILRQQILSVISDSNSYEEFLKKLLEQYGIEITESRGRIGYLLPDRKKPIRGRQLGTLFEKESIEEHFQKKRAFLEQQFRDENDTTERKPSVHPILKKDNVDRKIYHSDIRLIVEVRAVVQVKESLYQERKITLNNLQQASKTLLFLEENGIGSQEQLNQLLASTKSDLNDKHTSLKETEAKLKSVNQQIHVTGQYLSTKSIYRDYLQAKNKQQFREEHRSDLTLYEAARRDLRELTGSNKIPSLKQLKAEKAQLTRQKNERYEAFSYVRSKSRELDTIQKNVASLLEEPVQQSQETEHHKAR